MKKVLVCILALCLFLNTIVVYAETDPSWGSPTPGVTVQNFNVNDTWLAPMSKAVTSWNGTPTKVSIAYSNSSPNRVLAQNRGESWYGLSTSPRNGSFTIYLNARTISGSASNFSGFVQSVLVHEFGHIFSLMHTNQVSIMNSARNRNTMTVPQQFDINEVNSVYR